MSSCPTPIFLSFLLTLIPVYINIYSLFYWYLVSVRFISIASVTSLVHVSWYILGHISCKHFQRVVYSQEQSREIWYFYFNAILSETVVLSFEDLEYIIWCFQFVFFLPVIKLHIFHIFMSYLYLLFYEMSVKPRCQQTFSVNSQILSLLDFVGHAVFC